MYDYDVVVVGAGMAGLLAARAAAENGVKVAIIERKADPTKLDRACGQTIPSMNEYMFNNICNYNATHRRLCFSGDGFSIGYDGPYQNLYSLTIFAPNGHPVIFGDYQQRKSLGDFGRVGMAFDKGHLIENMLDAVLALSVKVFTGLSVSDVTTFKEGVVVGAGARTWKARYLIAADGVNSRIVNAIGFNTERHFYCCYYALSYYVKGLRFPNHDQMVKLMAYLPEGYAYSYIVPRPYEDEFNMLILSVDPRVSLAKAAEHFMRHSFAAPWFEGVRKVASMSAICNCYSPIITPYRDNILVTGDAGATQEMENTGAMISGWKAGNAVAAALLEAQVGGESRGIQQYLDWWRRCYVEAYSHDLYLKGIAQQFILNTADDVNYVLGMIKETLPACFNAYSSPTRQAMSKILPLIQQERPDIYGKLLRKNIPAAELLAPLTAMSQPVLVE